MLDGVHEDALERTQVVENKRRKIQFIKWVIGCSPPCTQSHRTASDMGLESFPVQIYSRPYKWWILRHNFTSCPNGGIGICCSATVAGPDMGESHDACVKEVTPPIYKKGFILLCIFMVNNSRAETSCAPACFALFVWLQSIQLPPHTDPSTSQLDHSHAEKQRGWCLHTNTLHAREIPQIIKPSELCLSSQIIYFSGIINGMGCWSVW